jgi:hypothetical protein
VGTVRAVLLVEAGPLKKAGLQAWSTRQCITPVYDFYGDSSGTSSISGAR